jgi:succinate dehydrogenase/fumarate reductase-like Fe-S protein
MKKIIKILRYDPENDKKPHFRSYEVNLDESTAVL